MLLIPPLGLNDMIQYSRMTINDKTHYIWCFIWGLIVNTRNKILSPIILFGVKARDIDKVWTIFKNICRWIIHSWRNWSHCLLSTTNKHYITSNHHCNCIHRRINTFILEIFNAFQNTILSNPEVTRYRIFCGTRVIYD